jgi:hypothetical protein
LREYKLNGAGDSHSHLRPHFLAHAIHKVTV